MRVLTCCGKSFSAPGNMAAKRIDCDECGVMSQPAQAVGERRQG